MIVFVIYALPEVQYEIPVDVRSGSTVADAIQVSGILQRCPEIDLNTQKVGRFSRVCALTEEVCEGDRVEIYRPLLMDPKERRRIKAKQR